MVQSARSEDQPNPLHRRGRGEVGGVPSHSWEQVGSHCPPLPWTD
ncbi:hypothetical protein LINPERPRIM_LOCUS12326 [Linum perenne]